MRCHFSFWYISRTNVYLIKDRNWKFLIATKPQGVASKHIIPLSPYVYYFAVVNKINRTIKIDSDQQIDKITEILCLTYNTTRTYYNLGIKFCPRSQFSIFFLILTDLNIVIIGTQYLKCLIRSFINLSIWSLKLLYLFKRLFLYTYSMAL
jgi:hypothetical protein